MNWRKVFSDGFRLWKQSRCSHEFRNADLKLTGIPVPPMPNDYDGAMEWYRNQFQHPSHSERVSWRCHKCDKEFRAHCGLDVLRHGTPVPN